MNDFVPEISKIENPELGAAMVVPNQKSRLRFINTSAYARFYITIPYHSISVIELDGVSMSPGPNTTGIELASGQRVSVLVTGNQGPNKTYPMIAAIDPRLNSGTYNDDWGSRNVPECVWTEATSNSNDHGIVEFTGGGFLYKSDSSRPKGGVLWDNSWLTRWSTCEPGKCNFSLMGNRLKLNWAWASYDNKNGKNELVPLYPWNFKEIDLKPWDPVPKLVDVQNANIHFMELTTSSNDRGWGTFNANRFKSPETNNIRGTLPSIQGVPALLRILQKDNNAINDPGTYIDSKQTIVMQKDEIHWFVIRGKVGDHPIHMHGHAFQILAHRINDFTDDEWNGDNRANLIKDRVLPFVNANPSRRDTLMVEKFTISVIAIKADNPGVWGKFIARSSPSKMTINNIPALHCHNDFHALTGMMMQLIEAPQEVCNTIGTWKATPGLLTAYYPTGPAATDFDDQAKQAFQNGINLFVNYWYSRGG